MMSSLRLRHAATLAGIIVISRFCLAAVPAFAADPVAKPAVAMTAAASSETTGVEVKSTLENLQAAFNGESNAHARYLEFARKADAEGYGKVASLFRAAARSEEIHATNHAKAIKAMGGREPKAEIKPAEVKSTRENLQAAIDGELYENRKMYPAFFTLARKEGNRNAMRTLNWAREVEAGHAKLYREALNTLDAWKAPQEFFVCSVCGNTVMKVDFRKCPVCFQPKEKYETVK